MNCPCPCSSFLQAVALARLRPQHLTISDRVLAQLAAAPGKSHEELDAVTLDVVGENSGLFLHLDPK